MQKLSPVQRKVFIGCFVVYSGAYIGRLNLAAALPSLMASLSLSEAQGGLVQTLFAIVYASGQLINGAIVDKVSPKRMITIGLIGSVLCNLLLGTANAYWQVLVCWALNGVFQSMLWTPVVRLMAGWFDPGQRKAVSLWMSFAIVGGHFISWAISGYMAQLFSWRFSFIVPAIILVGFVGLALWLLHDPQDSPFVTAASGDRRAPAIMPLRAIFFETGLWLVLICCVASGFVRDGVMTWGPTILAALDTGSFISPATLSLVIPVINLLGILLGQACLRRSAGNTRLIITILMLAGSAISVLLIIAHGGNAILYALLLGASCALMNGVNPLETVVIPMDYVDSGRVGLVAGVIDASIYVGSALVSISTGLIKDAYGLSAVFTLWAIVAVAGAIAMALSIPGAKRHLQR